MLDEETLRPVIISMALYITIATLVPILFKKPTGVKVVDDLTLSGRRQNDMLMSGTILVGLITFGTNYIQESELV